MTLIPEKHKTDCHSVVNRSVPQYFAEIKDSGSSNQNREGIDFDFYADANAAETSDDMKFQRNKTAISMLNAQIYTRLFRKSCGKSICIGKCDATSNGSDGKIQYRILEDQT